MGTPLSAREAADRLGVDVRTLYAYVSRGALRRTGGGPGHRSSYDSDEVELLARRSRPRTVRRTTAGIDVVIGTTISTISDGHVHYRHHDAITLAAANASFERTATLLWTTTPPTPPALPWHLPTPTITAIHRALRSLPPTVPLYHRMTTAVTIAAATTTPPTTSTTATVGGLDRAEQHGWARQLIAAMVESIVDGRADQSLPIAGRIWAGRSDLRPTPARVTALNAALVLLAEHELATSTLAIRVAASTRVGLDGILLTGLGTLGGPLHGQVSDLIHGYLVASRGGKCDATVDVELVRKVAFGHPVHRSGDPRAALMLERVWQLASPADRAHLAHVQETLAQPAGQGATHRLPNVDFALAALAYVGRMAVGSAGAIFAIARAAGWVAHALEEYQERPLRYRGRALSRTVGR